MGTEGPQGGDKFCYNKYIKYYKKTTKTIYNYIYRNEDNERIVPDTEFQLSSSLPPHALKREPLHTSSYTLCAEHEKNQSTGMDQQMLLARFSSLMHM